MKSIQALIASKNKRGQVIELVGGTIIGIMVLIFLIFAVLYAISILNPSSFFTANSSSANATTSLQNNLTSGVSQFGGLIPSILLVLGIVLVLAAILVLILYVRRMQSGGTGGGVSL